MSGLLAKLPPNWRQRRVGTLATLVNGYPFDSTAFDASTGHPLIRIRDLNRASTETRYNGPFEPSVEVGADDLLIGMDGDFNVGRWLGDEPALLNQRMCLLRGESEVIRYLSYALPDQLRVINDLTYSTTVKHLSSSQVLKATVAIPDSSHELLRILHFLDRETAQIDAVIAKQEELIKLLGERRSAVIAHAVTKGLNPDAPLKDSGVDWLGEVPAHWRVLAIKRVTPVQRGASPRPIDDPVYFDDDGEWAWVRIADVTASGGELHETTQRLSELGSSLSVKMEPGQLFVSIAGTVGKPCITRIRACIHDGFVYFPLLPIQPEFLFRIFEAGECYRGLGKLGTQLNLNTDTVGGIKIAVPPADEVAAILRWLNEELASLDEVIGRTSRSIELMRERRSAMISDAVTGRLDIDTYGKGAA